MREGRHADSARRQQRVTTALERSAAEGAQICVSAIARAAGVDRSFPYRHRDPLAKIHALAAQPPATSDPTGPIVTEPRYRACKHNGVTPIKETDTCD
jgi:hypothetical protein